MNGPDSGEAVFRVCPHTPNIREPGRICPATLWVTPQSPAVELLGNYEILLILVIGHKKLVSLS